MRNVVKVLIVDDDKSSSAMLGEVVKRLGFKPVIVNKPLDALNIVRLQTVHAAIVDVLLPKMSGVDLVSEFRKTKFADNPVIFVSGVFKDKAFASEAMHKTGAADFLFKPFGANELTESLQKALAPLLNAEKWSVQSLITRKFNSDRDRAKAIEHLEEIKGLDFPYVLSFLLEAKVSGQLNIVNNVGEIFGVNVVKGTIAEVDSAESASTCVLALINNGFLAQEDWDEYEKNNKNKFHTEDLVQEGLVSPHAIGVAKHEQILSDFRGICSADTLQLNFAMSEADEEPPKHVVRMGELLVVFLFSIQEFFPDAYLSEFYQTVLQSPLHLQQSGEEIDELWNLEIFRAIPETKALVLRNGNMQAMLDLYPEHKANVYQGIHLLVLNGWVVFDDLNRAKNLEVLMARYRKLHAELEQRNVEQIFEYFGANTNAPPSVFDAIFAEYVKSNNPDVIAKESSPELLALCQSCYDLVKNAYDIMTDTEKRQAYQDQKQELEMEKTKLTNRQVAEGLDLLRKGQFPQALAKLRTSGVTNKSSLQFLITTWAEIKADDKIARPQLEETRRKLETLPNEDRKSAYYYMALGLLKKALGDRTALGEFEKALQIDPQFIEARREMKTGPAGGGKKEKIDILNGDITEIVSHLFRRKAD